MIYGSPTTIGPTVIALVLKRDRFFPNVAAKVDKAIKALTVPGQRLSDRDAERIAARVLEEPISFDAPPVRKSGSFENIDVELVDHKLGEYQFRITPR